MSKLKLDLHDVYNNSTAIETALQQAVDQMVEKKLKELEIISGKGSGQLREKVKRFLMQPNVKPLYKRIVNDSKNHGRLFVYFR